MPQILKIGLLLLGSGTALIAFCLLVFTAVMFLVPTSSPNQLAAWNNNIVTVWGISMTELSAKRLEAAVLGLGLTTPFVAIAFLSFWILAKQR